MQQGRLWAVVLAGGDGTRLSEVTTRAYGYGRPKQFCALLGPITMVEQTIARADLMVPRDRIVVSTTRAWREEATECLRRTPGVTVSEQPANAGTTPGVLKTLLEIFVRDPEARVVLLPSDHHVSDDVRFAESALAAADSDAPPVVLLGADLPQAEEGLGWIEPVAAPGEASRFAAIRRFTEKPDRATAERLLAQGALANTFAMVAEARALIELIAEHVPHWWRATCRALGEPEQMARIYRELPPSDLSREVLQRCVSSLHVAALGDVGWSDVGTPARLAAARAGTLDTPLALHDASARPRPLPSQDWTGRA